MFAFIRCRRILCRPALVYRDGGACPRRLPGFGHFVRAVADKVVFLYGGRVHEIGPPQVLEQPQTAELDGSYGKCGGFARLSRAFESGLGSFPDRLF